MDPALKNASGLVVVVAVVAFVVLVAVIAVVVIVASIDLGRGSVARKRSRMCIVVDGFDAAASYILVVRNTV